MRPLSSSVENTEGTTDLALMTVAGADSSVARVRRPVPAPVPLAASELRAIVPLEKELEVVIPLRGYPSSERPPVDNRPIYAEARIGLYTTAVLDAGYSGATWPFDYSAQLALAHTGGFVDNASGTGIAATLGGGYIIGTGYGMFSGGHMGAEAGITSRTYRRYAVTSAPERSIGTWHAGVSGSNTLSGLTFDAHGAYRTLNLTDSLRSTENSLDGQLEISTGILGLKVAAGADLRLTVLRGGSIGYGNIDGTAAYSSSFFTARGGAAIVVAGETDGNTVVRFAPMAELRLYPFSALTLSLALTGGVAQNTLQHLLATNLYVVADPAIKHEVERVGYRATLRLEPVRSFALRLSAARSSYDSYAYFDTSINGTFAPLYNSAGVTKIDGDFFMALGRSDEVSAMVTFVEGSIGDSARAIPFVPKWTADVSYTHRLRALPIAITGTARYIGRREASAGRAFDPAVTIGLEGSYSVASSLDLFLELRNLLGKNYELWEGYRERGFFGAIGARTSF